MRLGSHPHGTASPGCGLWLAVGQRWCGGQLELFNPFHGKHHGPSTTAPSTLASVRPRWPDACMPACGSHTPPPSTHNGFIRRSVGRPRGSHKQLAIAEPCARLFHIPPALSRGLHTFPRAFMVPPAPMART